MATTATIRKEGVNTGQFVPGQGRKRGVKNKVTRALKAMILGALAEAGGQAYLTAQAKKNPKAFLALVGRLVPQELKADVKTKAKVVVVRSYGAQ